MHSNLVHSLSIDWEDWYQVPLARVPLSEWKNCKPAVEKPTELLLTFLKSRGIRATFFISGYCAERHPDMVRAIASEGHELESHGYWHELAYNQTPERFVEDLVKSREIILSLAGKAPIGYRSPAWSITRIVERAMKTLMENGFRYDSSLFPNRNFLFGAAGLSSETTYSFPGTNILEIPPSTIDIGLTKIPVTGGFYLRTIPIKIFRLLMKLRSRVGPAMIYLHPWEIVADYPRMPIPRLHAFIQYHGCGTMLERLEALVDEFQFGSFRQAYPMIENRLN